MIKATWHGWRLELEGAPSNQDMQAILDAMNSRKPVILCGRPVLIDSVVVDTGSMPFNDGSIGAIIEKPRRKASTKITVQTCLYAESVYSPNVGGVVTPLLSGKGA